MGLCSPERVRVLEQKLENLDRKVKRMEKKKMLVLAYRKCNTCLKALKWLEEHQVDFKERSIVEEHPTYEELKYWYEKSGLPLKKFFNTSGLLYKELNLKEKLPEMTEEEQLKLLATNGMLVKRPLVVGGDFVLVGFKEQEWNEQLCNPSAFIPEN